ncbi:MAG: SBBP repeat-containing protein [Bryobacteraceae bacterium]
MLRSRFPVLLLAAATVSDGQVLNGGQGRLPETWGSYYNSAGAAEPTTQGKAFQNVPLHFEANRGQYEKAVRFATPGLLLAPTEARLLLSDNGSAVIRMQVEGGNPGARMSGLDKLPGESNYFLGDDPQYWRTHVPHFARVRSERVYPGIDLIYYGKQRQLEFDFVVAPGSDPRAIRLRFDGATPRLEASGDLLLENAGTPVRLQKPDIYQEIDGVRKPISGRFRVDGQHRVGFEVGSFDNSRTLVIDPVLSYSTLLTASSAIGEGIAVDAAGNAYLTGNASSSFLTVSGLQPAFASGRAAFVAKFNAAGTVLLYSTFLAGSATESGAAPSTAGLRIAVDREGNAYVVGSTGTTNFPVTAGSAQPINRGGDDLFVSKLNPSGSALVYSTYLGGNRNENAQAGIPSIAVDATGGAYIAGGTASSNFPVTNGALQTTYGGGPADAFIAKLDPLGSTLVYSTFLGGASSEAATAIAVDAAGNAYIAGTAGSAGFPRAPGALQPAFGGGDSDVFLSKINPAGTAPLYSTYLGGSGLDVAFGIAVDARGNAFVTGVTDSPNFPVTAQAFQKAAAGGDAFVSKLNPAGTALEYSTYLGGGKNDFAYSIAIDAQGNAHVAGGTESPDFPVTPDAFQSGLGLIRRGAGRTAAAAFLTKLNAAGSALAYSTYFGGGGGSDAATAVALDGSGNAYVTGLATSVNFPRTAATYEPPDRTAFATAFLAKFDFGAGNSMSLGSAVNAASYQTGVSGVVAPGQIVVLFGNEIGPAQLATLRLTADGRVDTSLAGVRVLFDGVPAPLLYVSAKQVSAVVPYGVPPSGRTVVQVDYRGLRSNPLVLWVAPALVGIFTQDSSGRGPGAILNQDGTVNSPSNPAEKGSVVVLFGTGEGRTQPEGVDGSVASERPPKPLLTIFAQISDRATEVVYVGGAPGLVAGVLQMNIRVPPTAPSGPAVPIFIGGMDGPFGVEPSERVTIAIR